MDCYIQSPSRANHILNFHIQGTLLSSPRFELMWFASVDMPLRHFSSIPPRKYESHEVVLVEPFLVAPAPFPPRTHQLLVPPLPLFFLLLPLLSNGDYESASTFLFYFFQAKVKAKD